MKQYSILVVEDNQVNQLLLEQQLRYLGYQVSIVDNGASALQRIAEGDIDVILTDIRMPGMDGYELTQKLKSAPDIRITRIPVIAITANATADDKRNCLDAGMDDFIAKPIDLHELKAKLVKWTEYSAVAATSVPGTTGIGGVQEAAELDISPLLALAEGDTEVVNRILNKFLGQTAILVDEIHRACTQKDSNSVVFNSHKLRSSAGSIGARRLADICASLESAGRNRDWDTILRLEDNMEQAYHSAKLAIADKMAREQV